MRHDWGPQARGFEGALRILFVTATRVGDAILSSGLLDHLIRRAASPRVTVACGPVAAPLFEAVPGLERILVLDKMMASLHWAGLWAACVGRLWDVLVDLRNAPVTFLIPARRRYRMDRGRGATHRVRHLAAVLGLEADPPAPHLWVTPRHRARARTLVSAGAPVLAVGPTANWAAKTWRPENFAALIERLTGPGGILPGARTAILGGEYERPSVLPLIESVPADRRIDLVGRVDLLTAFACLGRCAFYVGNDSGPMHLAACSGIPTLGLFGPSPADLYAPWGDNGAVARTRVPYEEIFPADFDHRASGTLMDSLSVDDAEAAARALWQRTRGVA